MDTRPSTSPATGHDVLSAPANDPQVEITIEIVEIVEIETYGRENRRPPPAKAYKVRIDHDPFVFHERHVTGRQLLEKAGKTPADHYEIEKRMHGGAYVPVRLDETVDLGEHGIEVFETFPLDETEG